MIVEVTEGHGWYTNAVGMLFKVYEYGTKDYVLAVDYDLGHNAMWRHIDKAHCVVAPDPACPYCGRPIIGTTVCQECVPHNDD